MPASRAFVIGSCLVVGCMVVVGSCGQPEHPLAPRAGPGRPSLDAIDPKAPILVGAGDIARCGAPGAQATAALLDSISGTVITLGDDAYPSGTDSAFANCYDPTWGRQLARTRPTAGDVEYSTSGAAGYYAYYGPLAGDPAKGYYSYDVGGWHVVVLNSNLAKSVGSDQETWLLADLAANTKGCTLAYWHHPLFWSSTTSFVRPAIKPLWDDLYEYGAELVLNAHARNYERFMPQRPDGVADSAYGIREIIVGTGGYDLGSAFGTPMATSEVRDRSSFGVLAVTLESAGYRWRFVPVAGSTFSDSGYTACHGAPPAANAGGPYTGVEGSPVQFDGRASWSAGATPVSYAWRFGDGGTDTGATPTHVYAHDSAYAITLIATYANGRTDSASSSATITNVAPVVNAGHDLTATAGSAAQLAAKFTDAGSADGPWSYTVDWGDGSPLATGTRRAQPASISKSHTYTAPGSYAVRVTVTDVDGATGMDDAVVSVTASPGQVLVGAGDIVRCNGAASEATAALLDSIPGAVFTLGDNVYPATDSTYTNCYDPTWGRQKSRTRPAVGNHDYMTDSQAYFNYFGAAAGERGKGYYSYDLGDWHIIVLNSNKDSVSTARGSAQELWLRADLAANTKRCILAMWHHPLFYMGDWHVNGFVKPFWDDLYAYGADVVVNGHSHVYERYAPQTPGEAVDTVAGIRQFTVGTGGESHYDLLAPAPNVEVRDNTSFGVLKLTLRSDGYDWKFIPIPGNTFTDSGSGTCH